MWSWRERGRARRRGSLSARAISRLSLADQLADHRREPEEVIAFSRERLPALSQHRGEAAYRAALERIELAGAVRRFQELKRELGVIDFGDQITLALKVVEGFPEVV